MYAIGYLVFGDVLVSLLLKCISVCFVKRPWALAIMTRRIDCIRGSLGSMSSHGTLYTDGSSTSSEVITWTGNISTHASGPSKKNLFLQSLSEEEQEISKPTGTNKRDSSIQREIRDEDIVECLENDVNFWTDFSKVHYHPQSLYELCGLWMDSQEFDNYGAGRDIFSEGLRGEEVSERLRFFVEECDHIQGFQFIVDDSGAFSALAADFLENIADEYTNTPVLLYSVKGPGSHTNPRSQKQSISRKIHDAVSFSRLSSFCRMIVPAGLPFLSRSKASTHLCIEDEKPYHCSAVYAAALHSISLPFRMESLGPAADSCYYSGAMNIYELVQMLTGQDRQNTATILDVAMPAPPLSWKQDELSFLWNLHPLTPELAEVEDLQAVESLTVHGALGSGGCQASVSEVTDTVNEAYEHSLVRPKFCHLSVDVCPLPIPLPFPSIFGNLVSQHGELLCSPIPGSSSRGSLDVHSLPMAARLRSSSAILPFLENRLLNLRRYGIERGALGTELLRSWGFAKDELEDIEENLYKMVTTLDDRYKGSSDSD
ncbi:protein misato homolog 1 isoform X3 [Ricinus communis]|uniref:protein misato homolog 1 isoform X3 n=2 Tax=Ricinus communis TaxID=3988 RepID=UPI0007729417|nr:protein misato homolog 1 isoform X3 [Ricinus communis]|eukprot:XP_015576764.1 protein misato homolog 1 isoform X3 [Ricinus communis]